VAVPKPALPKAGRHTRNCIAKFRVSYLSTGWTVDQRSFVGVLVRALQHKWRYRSLGNGDVREGAAKDHVLLWRRPLVRDFSSAARCAERLSLSGQRGKLMRLRLSSRGRSPLLWAGLAEGRSPSAHRAAEPRM